MDSRDDTLNILRREIPKDLLLLSRLLEKFKDNPNSPEFWQFNQNAHATFTYIYENIKLLDDLSKMSDNEYIRLEEILYREQMERKNERAILMFVKTSESESMPGPSGVSSLEASAAQNQEEAEVVQVPDTDDLLRLVIGSTNLSASHCL
ncbi:hypothetical protein ILUMI_25308 [Ignelater luminosus]|uniref:Uncharacterized protein n=1 Tax=Ignelater luminosus TaxID=2038154 RepID=A0A8K0CA84_IGNLU|nr:hypothetical protein ILUMI_25308 [Ignelater luminosus]